MDQSILLMLTKILRYFKERIKWVLNGKKKRSAERVAEIFSICQACPNFTDYKDETGTCNICGCYIKKDVNDTNFNKAVWATTKCPDVPPRWF